MHQLVLKGSYHWHPDTMISHNIKTTCSIFCPPRAAKAALILSRHGLHKTPEHVLWCLAPRHSQDIEIYWSSSSHGCPFRLMFLKPFLNKCWHVAGCIILLKKATDIREQHCHCTWYATFFREVICVTCTWPSTWSKIKCNSSNQATFFQIKSNQITFIVSSSQHMCLGKWNSWEHAPDSAETINI